MPPDLKAKKCVIILRADDVIYDRDTADIGEEIVRQNTWIGEELENVYKFPNPPTIKFTFTQTFLANKCTETGLKTLNISIPANEIKLETYILIKCCMRCYSLESHYTNECPKLKGFKICSECSSEGHVWHQCKETFKTCINCGDEQSTMAMKCKNRKNIFKEKSLQENDRQDMT